MNLLKLLRGSAVVTAIVLASAALAPANPLSQAPPGDRPEPVGFPVLPGAASLDHIWYSIIDPEQSRRSLIQHIATDRSPPVLRVAGVLDGRVEAMAARGDRVWIVLEPRAGTRPRREVVTLLNARNPASGLDYSWPREGPTLLPSLPGEGRLMGFAASERGPVALLWPEAWRSSRVRRGSDANEEPAGPELLRLVNDVEWVGIDLESMPMPAERLASVGDPAHGLLIAAAAGNDSTEVKRVSVESDGRCTSFAASEVWPFGLDSVLEIAGGDGGPLLVLRRQFGSIDLAYSRPQGLLDLARVPAPVGPWRIDATSAGVRMVELVGEQVTLREIDPLDGTVTAATKPAAPSFASGAWVHLPILGALAVSAVLALVLFRPLNMETAPRVPEGSEPLPVPRRLAALALDLLPGVLASMAIYRVGLRDFSMLPAWSLDASAAAPSAVAIAITVVWGLAWEGASGRTPGKLLVGGRVEAAEGGLAPWWRIGLRNLFKGVVLAAPILGLFTLLNPLGQGIGEVVSRTFVLARAASSDVDETPSGDAPPS